MPPTHRLARIVRWLERQGRWISTSDLHRWQQANLGSTRAKRAHDVRALVTTRQVDRRVGEDGRYEYQVPRGPPPAVIPAHVLARKRIERRLAEESAGRRAWAAPVIVLPDRSAG